LPSSEAALRRAALVCAAVALIGVLVPPLWVGARHLLYVETIQFCVAAFAVPSLLVVGRPLHLGTVGSSAPSAPRRWISALEARAAHLGRSRLRHPELTRALGFLVAEVAAIIVWRVPAVVDALVRHEWLLVPEALSLLVVGVGLWLEMIDCPPLVPRVARPWRAVIAALAMWSTWIVGFVLGFAHSPLYHAYHYPVGGLGAASEQQIAAGMLFVAGMSAFAPVVFSDVTAWLKEAEDPDAELRQLVRAERRSGWRPPWEPPPSA